MKYFRVFVVVVALGACSDDAGPGDDPIPFARYCDEYAQMSCQVAQQCDCLDGYSVAICQSVMRTECEGEVEEPVNAGRMSYDDEEAGECLDALYQIIRDCSLADADWPGACDRMLVGQVPEGGECDGDEECQGAMECYGDQCVLLPGSGQTCHPDYECAEDLFCNAQNLCEPYRGRGESCAESSWVCDDDLYCDSRTDTCQPYLQLNESCAHDEYACDDDLYCSPSTQTCKPYPTGGQGCADSYGDCADGYYCDANDICQPQLPGGRSCTEDEECLSWDCVDLVCEPDEDDDSVCDYTPF